MECFNKNRYDENLDSDNELREEGCAYIDDEDFEGGEDDEMEYIDDFEDDIDDEDELDEDLNAPIDADCDHENSPNKKSAKESFITVDKNAKIILLFLSIAFVAVLGKIFYLQIVKGGELKSQGEKMTYKYEVMEAKRGNLISEDGTIFAMTQDKYRAYLDMNPKRLTPELYSKGYEALADSLSALFKDATPQTYRSRLNKWYKKGHGYTLITPRGYNMDYSELQRFKKFPIVCGKSSYYVNSNGKIRLNSKEIKKYGGLSVEKMYVRVNLFNNLAQRTLGREKTEHRTGYGIENSFDKYLRGKNGVQLERKVSGDFSMPVEDAKNVEPVDGLNVITTIDAEMQDIADNSLREILEKNKAIWGTAVVMEVKTGKIKAMVNLGVNSKGEAMEDYNHAIADNLEPGSTFKIFPLITLLDDAKMDINDVVDTKNGVDIINRVRVSESKKGGYGVITLKGVMEHSSNIGFATFIDKYYRQNPMGYINSILSTGIADDIDFQLDGERKPNIKTTKNKSWSPADLVTMSYGYAVEMTALRTLMLYNAVANNGKMIKPIVVSKIVDNEGKTLKKYETEVLKEKICSEETLGIIKETLESVVTDGTGGTIFKDENYIIAGKTGTSKQLSPDGQYDTDEGTYYLASFVGYFPANDPKYSCIVAVKTFKPRRYIRAYYGSALAAPVFRNISEYIFSVSPEWATEAQQYAIQTEYNRSLKGEKMRNRGNKDVDENMKFASMPIDVKRGDIETIKEAIDVLKIDETSVSADALTGMSDIENDNSGAADGSKLLTVPNVIGMGLKDAILTLEKAGFMVDINGKGSVYYQSIKGGKKSSRGGTIHIKLRI